MRRLLAVAAFAAAAALIPATPAHAGQVTIREVDTTKWPTVRLVVLAAGEAGSNDVNVRDGRTLVANLTVGSLGKTAIPVGTVLTIDESASMAAGGRIESAKIAGHQFVDQMLPSEQIAVVAFNAGARVVAPLTSDKAALHRAIDGLVAHGETALWDGVQMAAGLLQARPELQPNIIVLSDGEDTTSRSTAAEARASALAAKAVVFGVGLGGGAQRVPAPDGLAVMAEATGGEYTSAADARSLPNIYGQLHGALQGQYELSFTSSGTEPRDVTVSVNNASASASVVPGKLTRGGGTNPAVVDPPSAPGFLSGALGKFIIVGLVLAAAGLLATAVALTVTRPRSRLDSALAQYGERSDGHAMAEDDSGMSLVETQFLRTAMNTASRIGPARQVLASLGDRLEQANLPLRPEEVAFVYGVGGVLVAALSLLFLGPILTVALVLGLTMLPFAVLKFLIRRRQKKFTKQLPDALNLLSGTLRAGFSLMQGVEAMADEVGEPMGHELRRVLAEARLGRPLDEALADMAERLKSPDFEWTVMAIGIQREVGGNLAELLETVAETMHARERLRADVKALTAEGRVSAIVIGIMPPALGAVMWVVNRPYIEVLFKESLGQVILAGSGLMAVFGFWWMKKTIEIEV